MYYTKLIEAAVGEAGMVRELTGPEDGTFIVREHEDVDRGTVRISSVMSYTDLANILRMGQMLRDGFDGRAA
jgi:hypothetical protein